MKSRRIPLILAMLTMLGPFSIDTVFPAFGALQTDFGVGPTATQQLLSVYLLAFAAMSMFYGPVSDAVGRKRVLLVSLGIYMAASIVSMWVPTFEWLLICRAVQGLSAGGASIVSRAIVRDIYEGAEAQRVMSHMMVIFGIAPAIAPVIGGWLLLAGPWPLIFGFLTVYSLAMVVAVQFGLPETHPVGQRVALHWRQLAQELAKVWRSAEFLRIATVASLAFGSVFLYVSAAAVIVHDLWGLGEQDFWRVFAPLIGAMSAGSWVSGWAAGRLPQVRLIAVGLLAASGVAALSVVAMTAGVVTSPLTVMIGPALLAFATSLAAPSLQLRSLDLFPAARGSAASVSMFVTLVFNAAVAGALVPIVASSMKDLAIASAVMIGLAVAMWIWHWQVDLKKTITS